MKYKVMYTAGAKRDLRNIFRYISEELLAPENAAGQTERIMMAIRKLDTMPNRNRFYEEEPWHSRGLRRGCRACRYPTRRIPSRGFLLSVSFHSGKLGSPW